MINFEPLQFANNNNTLSSIQDDAFRKEFSSHISELAQGRFVQTVELYKPEGQSLGFKVVGLNNENKHFHGIFIQEIHDNGIASRYVLTKVARA